MSENREEAPAAADSHINHAESISYWESVDADVNGMLGGFPYISKVYLTSRCLYTSSLFFPVTQKFRLNNVFKNRWTCKLARTFWQSWGLAGRRSLRLRMVERWRGVWIVVLGECPVDSPKDSVHHPTDRVSITVLGGLQKASWS